MNISNSQKISSILFIVILIFIASLAHEHESTLDAQSALKKMFHEDQVLRKEGLAKAQAAARPIPEVMQELNLAELNEKHIAQLKQIIALYGWPKLSEFDAESCNAAWILVQHSSDSAFQEQCLHLMQELPSNEIDTKLIAYLYDRIQVNCNKPQRYGTQLKNETGTPYDIEDPENVDTRRLALGLEPLEDYLIFCKECIKNAS